MAISCGRIKLRQIACLDFPPDAFTPSLGFFQGLGLAMLVAVMTIGVTTTCFFMRKSKIRGGFLGDRLLHTAVAAIIS